MADILRIQEEAKDRGYNTAEFYIAAPNGVFKAKWLDAYVGFFEIPELGDGFLTERHLPKGCEAFWTEDEAKRHDEENGAAFRRVLSLMQSSEAEPDQ